MNSMIKVLIEIFLWVIGKKKPEVIENSQSIIEEENIKQIEVIEEEVIVPIQEVPKEIGPMELITTEEAKDIYGEPNQEGSYLVTIKLPYPMKLAWDLDVTVTRMRCHELVSDEFLAIFNDILEEYGIEEIEELGIDIFGGCFNYRKMRGGPDWSRHSWGIAIDLDPERNGLRKKWKNCQFSKPEYKPMIDIFYKHGFQSLGVEKDYDGMHFQANKLLNT